MDDVMIVVVSVGGLSEEVDFRTRSMGTSGNSKN